jgi:PHD/YefM family antitoxin component YafN of YafNO toxin-antitoxin module
MAQTTAVEFQRKFGAFQHQARREPVEITRHGRRELVLMSAVVANAVQRAEMDPEHAGLDDLLT